MSTTDPAAETLPTPPNPYRATVVVEFDPEGLWCVYIDCIEQHGYKDSQFMAELPSREEAEHHASLILSALHQATREDQ